jgi:uncharacterized membrane protein
MVRVKRDKSGRGFRFLLAPNRSISWRELLLFYLLTCIVALAIGLFFTLQGLWLVLPFSGLEMLALGLGLYVTSRKVYRREVILLDSERVRIEKGVQRIDRIWEFSTPWVSIRDDRDKDRRGRRRLVIGASGSSVEVGSFLANSEKDELAFQLKDCIIRV